MIKNIALCTIPISKWVLFDVKSKLLGTNFYNLDIKSDESIVYLLVSIENRNKNK